MVFDLFSHHPLLLGNPDTTEFFLHILLLPSTYCSP